MKSIFYQFDARMLPLGNVKMYFESGKTKYLHPLFGRFYEKQFKEDFANMFSTQNIATIYQDDQYLISLYNRAYNQLPSLVRMIYTSSMAEQTPKVKKRLSYALMEAVEETGINVEDLQDIKRINDHAERLQRKYRGMLPEKVKVQPNKKFDFNQIVMNVERLINREIDDSLRLYVFRDYFQMALKKARKIREN